MDELCGTRALRLPVAREPVGDPVALDVMPFPVGGMGAIAARMGYPPSAVRDSLEGRVLVDAAISATGEVEECRVLRGVRADLDSAAVKGVRGARFTPAQAQGKAVAAYVAIPIAFKLEHK